MQKEVNKLLKRINVEKLKNNHKECVELYNIIGGLYSDIGSYEEAIHYHEQALELSKTIGDTLSIASVLRYIGECKASLGLFLQAIDKIKKYLELAQKCCNKVEIQRAWTTLGRVYLMQAQDLKESSNLFSESIKTAASEAEKKFQTALQLAESVRDQVDEKEYAQMNCSLLNNLALIDDICGRHRECVIKFSRAIEICKKAKLKEDLYRCQAILAGIFRKRGDIRLAVKTSDEALITAKSIGKKILISDAYIEKGLVKILQRDFKNAKRNFAQAYLEKSPNEEDHSKAIKFTKLTHLISETYDKISQDNNPSEMRQKLCDKLGDLFVAMEFYKLAIEYYKRALSDAKLCLKPKSELARILYSIAETYADDGQFEHALICYEKELAYREGNNKEQCQSLIKIAHMQEYLNREPEKISLTYEKAYEKTNKDPRLMFNVLKDYVAYMKKKMYNQSRLKTLEEVLLNLKSYSEVQSEMNKEDEEEVEELEDEIANIDDIISADEDEDDEVLMVGRRRARGTKKFKANEVGDTPLHEASIKGDFKRVKSLISQGHEVNPRDNAGWIPLHEACNHGHYEIAEYLIENGGDVNNRGLKGMSPLHDAATNGHFDIMRLLIRNGANVIALTDTGETVLGCLRDYKKRNYESLSNRQVSEYKQVESELLNIMDKRGFNLMEASMKSLGSRTKIDSAASTVSVLSSSSSRATTSVGIKSSRELETKPGPKSRLDVLKESTSLSNPVKDYKNAMGTLKRKRTTLIIDSDDEEETDPVKKDLPAIYETSDNPSRPTKDWLIDDVSRIAATTKPLRQTYRTLNQLEDWTFSEDDEDDRRLSSPHPMKSRESEIVSNPKKVVEEFLIDDEDESLTAIVPTPSPVVAESVRSCSNSRPSFEASNSFNAVSNPLVVSIEDRKLLIPIKDDDKTIKWLKESIVERYSVLVNGAKPIISVAPVSDKTCFLYDGDLCKDVIRENLIVTIDSWQIDSVIDCYTEACKKFNITPLEAIEKELRRLRDTTSKLDLSYCSFPRIHVRPLALSLARRNFIDVKLKGCSSLFDFDNSETEYQEMLESIGSWKRMKHLKLAFTGLRRCHFEAICSRMKLPELESLDVSDNPILYKCKREFERHIESLLEACPNLKRLDVRRIDVQSFVAPNNSRLGLELLY